jgi:transposase
LQLIGQRTQLTNAVRGHLSEFGIVAERGLLGLAELAEIVRDESDQRLPTTVCGTDGPCRQIKMIITEIAALDSTLRKEQGERAGPAPRDHSLGWSGDRQCARGPCHRR